MCQGVPVGIDTQQLEGGEGGTQVGALAGTGQVGVEELHVEVFRVEKRAGNDAGAGFENGSRLVVPFAAEGGDAGLEDAGLLGRDGAARIAQQGTMVQADAGHDGQFGREYVGTVQTAAQADLDHGNIDFLAGEPPESQAGRNLEERQSFEVLLRQESEHFLARNHRPAAGLHEFDPLAEIHQVRRGVQAHAQPGGG